MHDRGMLMTSHDELTFSVSAELRKLGVKVVLGERVSTPAENLISDDGREKVVRTGPGGEYPADLVVRH